MELLKGLRKLATFLFDGWRCNYAAVRGYDWLWKPILKALDEVWISFLFFQYPFFNLQTNLLTGGINFLSFEILLNVLKGVPG